VIRPITALGILAAHLAIAQPAFETASVKTSASIQGRDGVIEIDPGRFSARNTTLKRLIAEAWQIPYAQISGGPAWLNNSEYDLEAKSARPASASEMKTMLRALLSDRFQLKVRKETRTGRIYALKVAPSGFHPDNNPARTWRFHGDLDEFANRLAVQLTIPFGNDPTRPTFATGAAVPVVNKTGIEGAYDFSLYIRPDPGADPFVIWQRALREQLGLTLEAERGSAEYLVIENAQKTPAAN
jgi:uncharacterized protein (TIGR03435 family)